MKKNKASNTVAQQAPNTLAEQARFVRSNDDLRGVLRIVSILETTLIKLRCSYSEDQIQAALTIILAGDDV